MAGSESAQPVGGAAAGGGELARSSRLVVSVAGLTVGLSSRNGEELVSPAAVKPFLVTCSRADLEISVGWGETGGPPGVPLFNSGGLWQLSQVGEHFKFDLATPTFGPEPYLSAMVHQSFGRGEIVLHPRLASAAAPVFPLQYPLDELLFTNLLARGHGIEVHGCGVVDEEGHGLLFLGHSGAGKSTTAALWAQLPGVRVLNDDRIVIRPMDGQLRMFGTPWHGEAGHARAEHAPLERILILEHGRYNQIFGLTGGAAAAALLSRSFVPHYFPSALQFSLAFVAHVVERIPCRLFRFVLGPEAVTLVRRSQPWLGGRCLGLT